MKTVVSTFGKFHAFELARQLERHQSLQRLFTTYPPNLAKLPRKNVTSLLPLEVVERATRGILKRGAIASKRHYLLREAYDQIVSRQLPRNADVFIGWSGCSELSITSASRNGTMTIVERGSSHIAYQAAILRDEYARFGLQPQLPSRGTIDKEIREYEAADYIMVPSTFARDTFLEYRISPGKIRVVPYGVDLNMFNPGEIEPDRFRVLFVGQMSVRKGVHYLLQAFNELQLPDSELWLVGSKLPEIDRYFIKYKGDYTFFGHQSYDELSTFYQMCSVFVLNSIEDGFGMVLPQAMASGLPIICTTNAGGADLIENGKEGFVIPIRDVDALKDRIFTLYNDSRLRARMGYAAEIKARTSHSWNDYGNDIMNVYRCLTGRSVEVRP